MVLVVLLVWVAALFSSELQIIAKAFIWQSPPPLATLPVHARLLEKRPTSSVHSHGTTSDKRRIREQSTYANLRVGGGGGGGIPTAFTGHATRTRGVGYPRTQTCELKIVRKSSLWISELMAVMSRRLRAPHFARPHANSEMTCESHSLRRLPPASSARLRATPSRYCRCTYSHFARPQTASASCFALSASRWAGSAKKSPKNRNSAAFRTPNRP